MTLLYLLQILQGDYTITFKPNRGTLEPREERSIKLTFTGYKKVAYMTCFLTSFPTHPWVVLKVVQCFMFRAWCVPTGPCEWSDDVLWGSEDAWACVSVNRSWRTGAECHVWDSEALWSWQVRLCSISSIWYGSSSRFCFNWKYQ